MGKLKTSKRWLFAALLSALLNSTTGHAQTPESPEIDPALKAILNAEAFTNSSTIDSTTPLLRKLLLRGFAHTPSAERQVLGALNNIPFQLRQPDLLERLEKITIERRLANYQRKHDLPSDLASQFDIPLKNHPLVETYIDFFSGPGRSFFREWMATSGRYIPIMLPILKEEGLPADTIYLAMIESGFIPSATSSASAAGIWQFIPSTGRAYKLRQNFWLDQRRDFIASTRAAARFLKKLHGRFGDWHLAWAAYNAGGGRISRALKKYKKKDFWSLIDHHPESLAKETRHYVPKLIAAALIAKTPENYGFDPVEYDPPLEWDTVVVRSPLDIRRLARKLGLPNKTLKMLNPSLIRNITPPHSKAFVRVPKGTGPKAQAWIKKLPPKERFDYLPHKIKRGDNLYDLARTYNTSISAIRDFNRIGRRGTIYPGKILLIPSSAMRTQKIKRGKSSRPKRAKTHKRKNTKRSKKVHIVAHGDTLWSIAQRYRGSVTELKRWNKRRNNTIRTGDKLHIF